MKKYISVPLGILCATTVLWSQEEIKQDSIDYTHDKIHLSDIIVKGDFYTDPTFTIEVNNKAEQSVQPKNLADLFKDVTGMSLVKRGNYAMDPSFRASQYEQLNVQYDGGVKAMHACPNRMDPVTTHVLPEEISKIEVIKGPYSVRYGANFGGVINLVTQKPGMDKKGLTGEVKSGFESNGTTYLGSAGLQYVGNDFHLKANGGYRNFGNYKDGSGIEIPSAFKSTDYALGAGYNINENHHIMTHWRQSFGRDVLHAGLPMDTDTDDSSIFSIDYYANRLKGSLNQFSVKAYYSFVDHVMSNTLRPNFKMMEMVSSVQATTIGGKIEAKWFPSKNMTLYTGADLFSLERTGEKKGIRKRDMQGNVLATPKQVKGDIWQDGFFNDIGVFTEGNYKLSKKFVLKAGVRLDLVSSEAKSPDASFLKIYKNLKKENDVNISGHLALKYAPSSKLIYELAFGQGVRSANMTERYINYFTIGQDMFSYVGNPNLSPETNRQVELGIKNQSYISSDSNIRFDYGLSLYYSDLSNFITAVKDESLKKNPKQRVKRFVNIKNAYKTGFEAFLDMHFTRSLKLETAFSYVYSRNKDFNESLPLTPPFTANMKLKYNQDKWLLAIKLNAVSEQSEIAKSFGENTTPGYATTDLEAVWKPFKGFSLGGAMLNVFDVTYHNHLNFSFKNQKDFGMVPINEPGRNFTLFARYSF